MPTDLRIFGITNRIFKIWRGDKYLTETKKARVIKDFQNIHLKLNFELKKKANNVVFTNNIVSLDWQKSYTFMVVRDMQPFKEWLTRPIEISHNHLKFLDEKNYLELKTKLPRLSSNTLSRPSIQIGNFTIEETFKIPQMLLRLFSDRQTFLDFVGFLTKLKYRVANAPREIIQYVLGLESLEKNLNHFYNLFKDRQKLQEKDILIHPLKKNEEFENMRLNSIRKKEQDKPVGMSMKINQMIREMSNC